MRQVTDKERAQGPKARTHASKTYRQRFTVEQSDVGTKRDHYLGQGAKEFTQHDVGRDIEVITDSGDVWVSWNFCAAAR